ncbi:ParB/RepB/Spo0J family partition protein [Pseudosulfitobacter pseudonitzschiae]|uniref:ParB/RepB/Spo0J family partition protein n=1 Tax=Pseudosulfitobacter pseudonitzschiae TaxID=1402135 RepID=UPI003B7A1790
MNIQAPIDAVRWIPLVELKISPLNTRAKPPEVEIEQLADSLRVSGLLTNLIGLETDTGVEIVAGGRRLRGLNKLTGDDVIDPIPVLVTSDPATAQAWAGAETHARVDHHPADEIRAYAAMAKTGRTPEDIARAFAKPVRHVRGRLALAALPASALMALRENRISLDMAKALTRSLDDTARLERVLKAVMNDELASWQITNALRDGRIEATDRRAVFVGLDTYRTEGGKLTENLFEDETLLHDEELLDRLFRHKLDLAAETVAAQSSWAFVTPVYDDAYLSYRQTDGFEHIYRVPVELPEADQDEWARLEELEDADALDGDGIAALEVLRARAEGDYDPEDCETAGVWVYVNEKGALKVSDAFRPRAGKTPTGANADGIEKTTTSQPPVAQAAIEDLHRIQTLALQTALVDKPELLLDLLAYQIEAELSPWSALLAVTLTDQPIIPEKHDAADSALILDKRLTDTGNATGKAAPADMAADFAAFRAKGKKHRNAALARHLARAVQRPQHATAALGAVLAADLSIDIRKTWTPDAPIYFSRCSQPHLVDHYVALTGFNRDDERVQAFEAQSKGDKVKDLHGLLHDLSVREAMSLSRADNARIDSWLPPEIRGDV